MVVRGSTQDDVRRHNLGAILTELHRFGRRSRAELTATMGLNRSTIGALVTELAAAGLVREGPAGADAPGASPRRAGRPSLEVQAWAERTFVVAVDLGVRHLAMARVGVGGTVLDRRDVPSQRDWRDLDVATDAIVRSCAALRADAPQGARCVGVGMSVPGIVRRPDGLLRFAPNLGWVDVPLGARLAERIGLPVTIGNDADLGAVAEHWRGVAVGYDNVVLMSGEIGIGGGILIDGRSLGGRGGYAGEIGHLRLNPAGRACRCGSWGCLETEIGIEALLRAANRPLSGGLTAYRTVLREAAGGRDQALAAAAHVAGWLGRGMGLLVNTFNPDIVVLAGALRELFAICGKQVAAEFSASSLVASREEVRLTAASLDPDGQLIGAAELAFGPLLDDPLGTLARIA